MWVCSMQPSTQRCSGLHGHHVYKQTALHARTQASRACICPLLTQPPLTAVVKEINDFSLLGLALSALWMALQTDISRANPFHANAFHANPFRATFIVSMQTDISPVVIEQMNEQHAKHFPALQHRVSDCRAMPEFKTGYFGAVIDKGA